MKKKLLFLSIFVAFLWHTSFAQQADSTKPISHFSGAVSVTNNGISLIPTFSLGKPAAIISLSTGRGRLSFDPELRFSLEGKPWSFLFWWRYKLVRSDRFVMNVGIHPALNFKTEVVQVNGISQETMVTRRYFAGELSPNYLLTKNISVGMYYLYSRGLDNGTIGNTHFLTLNSNFSNIPLPKQFFMKLAPQFYYLKLDQQDGFYFSAALTLANRNSPFSISTIINKSIQNNITASKDFIWNASLIYSFHKKYSKL